MKKATYREIPALLKAHKTFEGNSVKAVKLPWAYVVYSYETIIYQEDYRAGFEPVYFNSKYYSRTTSKLQNILRQVFNLK